MPTPNAGESKNEFITRCVDVLVNDENRDPKQALAICYSIWNKHQKNISENIINIDDSYELMHQYHTESIVAAAALSAATSAITGAGSIIGDELTNKNMLFRDMVKPNPAKLIAYDSFTSPYKIQRRPQGVIITDTRNHPIFPLTMVSVDTSRFWLPIIHKEYCTKYAKSDTNFLPWHYTVEMIDNEYYAFNTRPIDMRFPLTNSETLKLMKANNVEMNADTEYFFKNQPVEMQDCIHVCLIGDSSKDVYVRSTYHTVGRICIGPFIRYFRMPAKVGQVIHGINLGKRFKLSILDNELRS